MIDFKKYPWFSARKNLWLQVLGFLFFITQFILASKFYLERTTSFDSAAMSYQLVQSEGFNLALGRWGYGLYQLIPLIFIKVGAGLKTILWSSSVGVVLINYCWFIMITVLLKNKKAGLLLMLTLCLSYRNTFYFSAAIFSHGLPIVIVLYALLQQLVHFKKKHRTFSFIGAALVAGSLPYFHELLLLPVVFVFIYILLKHKIYNRRSFFILFGWSIFSFIFRLWRTGSDSYQGEKMNNSTELISILPDFFCLPSFRYFRDFYLMEFAPIIVLFGLSLVLLIKQRKFILTAFLFLFNLGYSALIILYLHKGEAPNMYQQYYIVFGFIVAFSIIAVRFTPRMLNSFVGLMVLLLFYGSVEIYHAHKTPTKRLNYIIGICENAKNHGANKFVIHHNDFPWGYAWVNWAVPIETMLISALDHPEDVVSFYVPETNDYTNYQFQNGQLKAKGWIADHLLVNQMNKDYFDLSDNLIQSYVQCNRRLISIEDCYFKIKENDDWLAAMKKKAMEQKLPVEHMVWLESKHLHQQIKVERENNLERQIQNVILRMKANDEWMKNLTIKAQKENLRLEDMMRLDAQYVINQR